MNEHVDRISLSFGARAHAASNGSAKVERFGPEHLVQLLTIGLDHGAAA